MVEQWARTNGLVLDRLEYHFLGNGPFEHVARTQYLWAVRTHGAGGQIRDAWLKCGHVVFGMWSRQIEVKWVEEGKSAFLDT